MKDYSEKNTVTELINEEIYRIDKKRLYDDHFSEDTKKVLINKFLTNQLLKGNDNVSQKTIETVTTEIHSEDSIRMKVIGIQRQMHNIDPELMVGLREELACLVADYAGDDLRKMVEDKKTQQDVAGFLQFLVNALFAGNHINEVSEIAITSNSELYPIHERQSILSALPAIHFLRKKNEIDFSVMLDDYQEIEENVEDINGQNLSTNKIELVQASKKLMIQVPKDRDEIAFMIKRFSYENGKSSKIKKEINFDGLKFMIDDQEKTYQLTAFIRHIGESPNMGHYIAYVKEGEDKWYYYNDDKRLEISGLDLEKSKQQAYIVKYATDGAKFPERQSGANNFYDGYVNRCWLNAALVFINSFTTISDKNIILTEFEKNELQKTVKKLVNLKLSEESINEKDELNEFEKNIFETNIQNKIIDDAGNSDQNDQQNYSKDEDLRFNHIDNNDGYNTFIPLGDDLGNNDLGNNDSGNNDLGYSIESNYTAIDQKKQLQELLDLEDDAIIIEKLFEMDEETRNEILSGLKKYHGSNFLVKNILAIMDPED